MDYPNYRTHSLRYNELFAPQKRPRILTHISGLNQSIVTIDTTLLSVSLDCYLGENYPLYEQRYYNYERNLHESDRIPIDVIEVWLRTLYPYQSQRNALLDRMIYEGKILYCLSQIFPRTNEYVLLGIPTNKLNGAKRTKLKYGNNLSVKSTCSIPNRCLSTSISSRPLSYRYFIKMHRDDWACWIGLQIIKAYANERKKKRSKLSRRPTMAGKYYRLRNITVNLSAL